MTNKNTYPIWRNAKKKSTLFLSVAALLLCQSSCSSSPIIGMSSNNKDISEVLLSPNQLENYENWAPLDSFIYAPDVILVPTLGVQTYIKEIAPNRFIIEAENIIDNSSSTEAIIMYLDGSTQFLHYKQYNKTAVDTLAIFDTKPMYKKIVDFYPELPVYVEEYNPNQHNLDYVLYGSAFGYYIGKPLEIPQNPNVYRFPHIYTTTSGLKKIHPNNTRLYANLLSSASRIPITYITAKNEYGQYEKIEEYNWQAGQNIYDTTSFYGHTNHNFATVYYLANRPKDMSKIKMLLKSYIRRGNYEKPSGNNYAQDYTNRNYKTRENSISKVNNTSNNNYSTNSNSSYSSSSSSSHSSSSSSSTNYSNNKSSGSNNKTSSNNYSSNGSSSKKSSTSNYSSNGSSSKKSSTSNYSSSSPSKSRTSYSSVSNGSSGHFSGHSGGSAS